MRVEQFQASFVTSDASLAWRDLPLRAGVYRQQGYRLTLTEGDWLALRFEREDGAEFELEAVTYDIAFPLTNAAKIIVPDTGRHFMETPYPRMVMFKNEFLVSSAHMSTPFFAYLDGLEQVTLAFGLMGKIIDTAFRQTSPAANAKFSLVVYDNECRWQIRKPYHERARLGAMTAFDDGFYQRDTGRTWFHALREYAEVWQAHHGVAPRTNEAVFTPELCTWRVINSDHLTHEWTVATAKECAALGIGALILDDGWFGVGLDSDIMESSLGNWPRSVPGKYPDIVDTIAAVRAEGVKPVLWYCPTGIGPQSHLYERAKPYCIVNEGRRYQTPGLFHTLCPRNPQAREILMETFRQVLDYAPDGYKPDLFNYMPTEPCEADHEHDLPTILEATKVCFQMMYEEAMRRNPEFLFMAKNDEANIDFCQYAPAVRAGDSPYDPNIMFLRCAYPNAFAKAVINDYLMLAGPETGEEIARCMIKQVTMGVPALSVDLLTTPAEQKAVLGAWLRLYNEQLMPLHKAARIEPQDAALTVWERLDRQRGVGAISLVHPATQIVTLPDLDRLLVLNAGGNAEIWIQDCQWQGAGEVTLYDHLGREVDRCCWSPGEPLPVPVAGWTELLKA
jgi:hypothetical protein